MTDNEQITNHDGDDEDHIDGCCSGVEFNETDATLDIELPATWGGVAVEAHDHEDGDELDGCDVVLSSDDETTDEELPTAIGGSA